MSQASEADFDAALARVQALRASLQAQQAAPVRLIETHISWVLLTREHAYKLKKPLRLPFVDFSTLAARRGFCEEELRLNRRLAPDLYLSLVEVRGGAAGPVFGDAGEVLDVAVKMRRFADGALWSERLAAGALAPQDVDRLAGRLAAFHRAAAVAPMASGHGSTAVRARVLRGVVEAIDAWHARARSTLDWPALRDWLHAQSQALAPLFEARRRAGCVRECHGDLHLANLLQQGDEATAFDCIEFDPALRWIDVLDDIAFAVMDLMAHGAPGLAFRLLDAWLAASGEHDGLPALRLCLASRALVRAQVAALAETQARAAPHGLGTADYVALALRLAFGADARLAITHGLPGSGKSFVAQRLLEAAGAIRLRSDVERKRLFGLGALQSSRGRGDDIYDPAATARTYARLHELARLALGAGWPVILDAAFLRAAERADAAALARQLGVPFAILDCRAPLPLLRERLRRRQARGGDASEADVAVLERLLAHAEPLDAAERAMAIKIEPDALLAPEELARRWRRQAVASPPSLP